MHQDLAFIPLSGLVSRKQPCVFMAMPPRRGPLFWDCLSPAPKAGAWERAAALGSAVSQRDRELHSCDSEAEGSEQGVS